MLKASSTLYVTYYSHYKRKCKMTKSIYKSSLLQLFPQLLLSPTILFNHIIKTMKPLYDVWKVNITRFAIYHLHYKDKPSNLTWSFILTSNNLYFLCSLNNLSIAPTCTIKPDLVIKKKNYQKILYIFFLILSNFHFLCSAWHSQKCA